MNGVGENTTIKTVDLTVLVILRIAVAIFAILFVLSLVMWILRKRKFKQTEIYTSYKEYKKAYKSERQKES